VERSPSLGLIQSCRSISRASRHDLLDILDEFSSPRPPVYAIRRADARLHDSLGHRPRTIAFPFGRHDDATDALVREFGYDPVFTTGNRIDAAEIPALMRAASEERIPA